MPLRGREPIRRALDFSIGEIFIMANTRRGFLQSGAALAAGLTGAGSVLAGQTAAQPPAPGTGPVQVPKMKFGKVEISRMVLGVNPFYGYAHNVGTYGAMMQEWYTQERVVGVIHQCTRYGINAYNYVDKSRAPQDWARFRSEGGHMHLIIQVTAGDDSVDLVKRLQPLALQRQGEVVDKAFLEGKLDSVKEWCKQARQLGVMVGVGSHRPEIIARAEDEGWDVDFYAGCVYNRVRTEQEWRQALHGELMEMTGDIYMQSDPPRMYHVLRQIKKPCFAFKILAAGRITGAGVEPAFRTAFEYLKPNDGVFVGMFPRVKDEVKENAEIVHRILNHG